MYALPPKADMCSATKDVRFVPKADIVGHLQRPNERGQISIYVSSRTNQRWDFLRYCCMPIYFFRLSTDEILVGDEGEELPSREAAIALAKEIAQDLSANQQPSYIRETAVVVTDEAGTELFRTPLKVDATSVRYDKSG